MGNCVSSQSATGVVEKQTASAKGRGLVAIRKAAMEKYPVSNKSRMAADVNSAANSCNPSDGGVQLRSKLRPPMVTARPLSVQIGKTTDSNGNISRPSSLPRLVKTETNVTAKIEPLASANGKPSCLPTFTRATQRQLQQHRTIINPPPVPTSKSTLTSKDSGQSTESLSPSPSSRSLASLDSNRSASVADSGIMATCSASSRSPTVSEKKSALSLKFGFANGAGANNRKPSVVTEVKKATVERLNCANAAPANGAVLQRAQTAPVVKHTLGKDSPAILHKSRLNQPIRTTVKTQPLANSVAHRTPTPQLSMIRGRAPRVLTRSQSSDCKPLTLRPRLSVEAIVASLEKDIRSKLGPDHPLPAHQQPQPTAHINVELVEAIATVDVERFVAEPDKAEITFVESESGGDEEDFIEDIELQLTEPSSSNSQNLQERDGCYSRDEGHPCDEEDSNATSISDAMIDDEIADQPGLVMLGQSASVPASPMHSWRSDLFHYAMPVRTLLQRYPPTSEEEATDSQSSNLPRNRLVGRRVASVSDINGGLKSGRDESSSATTAEPEPSAALTAAMRAELFSPAAAPSSRQTNWSPSDNDITTSAVVIELEDYASMANELADIKSQLLTLQSLLVDGLVDIGDGQSGAPLWDLKRDLVLLREELQEKNLTIRSLKRDLRSASGHVASKTSKDSSLTTKSSSCNVATQTDRPRASPVNVPPADNEDVHLVSSKLKPPGVIVPSGLPVRSRPVKLINMK